jgi:hypothetical protein
VGLGKGAAPRLSEQQQQQPYGRQEQRALLGHLRAFAAATKREFRQVATAQMQPLLILAQGHGETVNADIA